ncbi:Uncharacterised protein [Cedecea neteri]|uniref:Mor transcription activator family n=1 Tax=Cedecea neteri TaxID=158822 RepID=A0A291E191_9ENTR|nr:hypothetical protein [Cedecea neteri]ATF93666.1 hypothetical protein CO704_16875 [Cedecea neteri]SQA96710.1 Uncharacterised protein [Cedecea neteri]
MRELNLESHEDLLPETARQIARLIGFPAMQLLVERFGGASFPIGRNLRCTGDRRLDMLRETIGEENTLKLIRHFGGDNSLNIPRCAAALREYRNQCFLAEVDTLVHQGESLRMALILLGPKYGIANTRAWELLSRRRTPPPSSTPQPSLF